MRAISLLALAFAASSASAAIMLNRRSTGNDATGYVVDNASAVAEEEPTAISTDWASETTATADAYTTGQEAGKVYQPDSTEQDMMTGPPAISNGLPTGDCAILNFALTLEHLESAFYDESLSWLRYEDFERAKIPDAARVYRNFAHIAKHERQHVNTLQGVITNFCGTPVPPCKYNFGVSDAHSFLVVAKLLEKIGVSAYDGAIALINTGDIQTAAATIATVEGRHASFINMVSGSNPFPQDFEVPVAGPAIVTMASTVIESCPFDIPTTLGATPFKTLTLVSPSAVRSGRNIQLEYEGSKSGGHFCSFLFSDKSVTVALDPEHGCKVPKGAHGDIFVAVINCDEQLTLKNTKDLIIAGPIVINAAEGNCKDYVHSTSPPPPYSSASYEDATPEKKGDSYSEPSSSEHSAVNDGNYQEEEKATTYEPEGLNHEESSEAGIIPAQENAEEGDMLLNDGTVGSGQIPDTPPQGEVVATESSDHHQAATKCNASDETAVAGSSDEAAETTTAAADGPHLESPEEALATFDESQTTADGPILESPEAPVTFDESQTTADGPLLESPEVPATIDESQTTTADVPPESSGAATTSDEPQTAVDVPNTETTLSPS